MCDRCESFWKPVDQVEVAKPVKTVSVPRSLIGQLVNHLYELDRSDSVVLADELLKIYFGEEVHL